VGRRDGGERSLRNLRELALVVLVGIVVIGIVLAEPPVPALSLGDPFCRQRGVDAHTHQLALGDDCRAARESRRYVARRCTHVLVGLAATLAELSAIDFARAYATAALGLRINADC